MGITGVFSKCEGNSVNLVNSGNMINNWGMIFGQFKDPVCYPCLTGAVVANESVAQEVSSLNNLF